MNKEEIKEVTITPNELFTEWLEALRSGKYKQGTKYLHVGDEFCCLGVLCDIASKHRLVEKGVPTDCLKQEAPTVYFSKGDLSYAYDQFLPESLVYFLGFVDEVGYYGTDHGLAVDEWLARDLAGLNDSKSYSFTQIADFIEENREHIVTKVTI